MKRFENSVFFEFVEQELKEGRSVRFKVKGYSMQPLIMNLRDEVLLKPCVAADVKKGDIVLFKSNGQHILHRFKCVLRNRDEENALYKERENGNVLYKMQGDNVIGRYEVCSGSDILGVVSEVYKQKGDSFKTISPNSFIWLAAGYARRTLVRLAMLRHYFSFSR